MKLNKKDSTKFSSHPKALIFSGNIYIFYAFDIGDDIEVEKLKKSHLLQTYPVPLPKYFKNYHIPLQIELPHPHESSRCISAKVHQFGVISLTYKIPITDTLQQLRETIIEIDEKYQQQSVHDAHILFKRLQPFIIKPKFFHHKAYYPVIQINMHPDINGIELKEQYGGNIATLLRFETELLSEYQKEEILGDSIGYYKKDLIVIDSEAAFIYDPQYEELLDFFELGTIQQLELQYFDKLLDKQLTALYEAKGPRLPLASYLPFIGSRFIDPVGELNRLKVDISVITERLENSIRIAGEKYFSQIYQEIIEKFDLTTWQASIEKKFNIIKEIHYVYQSKIDANREDFLSILIIILIMIELAVATLH